VAVSCPAAPSIATEGDEYATVHPGLPLQVSSAQPVVRPRGLEITKGGMHRGGMVASASVAACWMSGASSTHVPEQMAPQPVQSGVATSAGKM
jgi:hypothetical protein